MQRIARKRPGAVKMIESEESRAPSERWLLGLTGARLLVASIFLGGLSFVAKGDITSFTPRVLVLATAATYAISFLFAIALQRGIGTYTIATGQILWDLLLITLVVYVSGGVGSVLTFLYGVVIILAAIVIGPRWSAYTTISALFLYFSVGLGIRSGWLPVPADQPAVQYKLPPEELTFAALSNSLGLILVGMLSSSLATRLTLAGGRLRRAEASVAKLERLNDDIVRSIRSGLLTTDLSGTIQMINGAGAEMFETPADKLVGTPVESILPGVDRSTSSPNRGEGIAESPTGKHFPVGHTHVPLVDANGVVTGGLISFQDLTEVVQLRSQAQKAEKLADLGRLAASLAHEIRNPLGSISGSVELVRDNHDLGEEDRSLLSTVIGEVDRLNDLVNTILFIGQPNPPTKQLSDLRNLASAVVAMAAKDPTAQRSISLRHIGSERPVVALIDAHQVRQVLWNLVKNAIQASTAGSKVEVHTLLGSDGRPTVQVIDEGEGIETDQVARLFETYHSTRVHGVGLGLTIVKQIVDIHKGEVEVRSRPGEGSVFTIKFRNPDDDSGLHMQHPE